jgi:hypothetical protein
VSLRRVARIREKGAEFLPLLAGERGPFDVSQADTAEFSSLMLSNAPYLLDAADALDDAHERLCGCEGPGDAACVAGVEFAALAALQVDG